MYTIKSMPIYERPRERLLKYGEELLSDIELLAIMIGSGYKDKSAIEVAKELLVKAKNLKAIKNMSVNELKEIKGIGEAKAITIKSALELGLRVDKRVPEKTVFNTPEKVYNYLEKEVMFLDYEVFICLYLDVKCRLKSKKTLSFGGIHQTIVNTRELLKWAIKESAFGMIIVHNHPSGDPTPSAEDNTLTDRLSTISKEMEILLCDHVIIGDKSFYSFLKEKNSNLH